MDKIIFNNKNHTLDFNNYILYLTNELVEDKQAMEIFIKQSLWDEVSYVLYG